MPPEPITAPDYDSDEDTADPDASLVGDTSDLPDDVRDGDALAGDEETEDHA